jgi:hypothetical protein
MKNIGLPGLLMIALTLLCVLLVLWGLRKTLTRTGWDRPAQQAVFTGTALAIAGWLVLLTVLSLAGFFRHFTTLPPRPLLAILAPAILLVILSFRKKCIELLKATPPHWLVVMQGFRIVVEIQLWLAFTRGLLPVQMTFEGRNYDIISGLLGLLAGWLMWRFKPYWKTISIIYNIIGLALLLNILVIAALSMPGPARYFMNEPANAMVAEFPFIFLPGGLVVLAIMLHVFSLRQVFLRQGMFSGVKTL